MKTKKIPMRTCVVTHERFPKKELVRIVRTPENKVEIDLTGKLNGRGAYLKKDKDVIMRAKMNKILDRKLEVEVQSSIYEEILSMIN